MMASEEASVNVGSSLTRTRDKGNAVVEVEDTACFVLGIESLPRRWLIRLYRWSWFERISMFIILVNCVTLAMYEPTDKSCTRIRCNVLENIEHFIFAFFLLEMSVKMIAMGVLGKKGYLQDKWNRLDFIIIVIGLIEKVLQGSDYLTIIRAFRVLRPLRAINKVPSTRILVTLLLDTLPMLGNVLLLSFLIFFVFGIIGVQLWQGKLTNRCFVDPTLQHLFLPVVNTSYYQPSFDKPDFICTLERDNGMTSCKSPDIPPTYQHGIKCTRSPVSTADLELNHTGNNTGCIDRNRIYTLCKEKGPNPFWGTTSFDNIAIAWMVIFQVITLEGWSEIMYLVQDSHSFWNWIYFIVLIVIGAFFLVNLCLVVITMQFQETKAREIELMEENRKRQNYVHSRSRRLTASCLQNLRKLFCPKHCQESQEEHVHHHHHHIYHHHHFHHHLYDCYAPASPAFPVPLDAEQSFFGGTDTLPVPNIILENANIEGNEHGEHHQGQRNSKAFLRPPDDLNLSRRGSDSSVCSHAFSIHAEAASAVSIDEVLTTTSVILTVPGAPSGLFGAAHASACATTSLSSNGDSTEGMVAAHASASAAAEISARGDSLRVPSCDGSRCGTTDSSPKLSRSQQKSRRYSQPFGMKEVALSRKSSLGRMKRRKLDLKELDIGELDIDAKKPNCDYHKRNTSVKRKETSQPIRDLQPSGSLTSPGLNKGEDEYNQISLSRLQQSEMTLNFPDNDESIKVEQSEDIDDFECTTNISRAATLQTDDDMFDSVFALHQCDSYNLSQNLSYFHRFRVWCRKIAESKYFMHFIMASILLNMICMGLEHHNQPQELTLALEKTNIIFVTIFSVEMAINLISYGVTGYISQSQNVFDGFVVIVSVMELLIENGYARLSVFRSIRLLRIFKLVRPVRYQLLVVFRTMSSVVTFFGLLFLFMFAFAILGMNLFGGKFRFLNADNEEVLARTNFDDFLWAMVTVFQILTQENWNQVMYKGMRATSNWAALYFIALMTVGYYVLFNLLVAILVEGFTSSGKTPVYHVTQAKSVPDVTTVIQEQSDTTSEKSEASVNLNPLIVISDEGVCQGEAFSEPAIQYCGHGVRNAFVSTHSKPKPMDVTSRKTFREKFRDTFPRVNQLKQTRSGSGASLDTPLTMPELKQMRQTSISILKKTRMNPEFRRHPDKAVINPAFIDDEEKVDKIGDSIENYECNKTDSNANESFLQSNKTYSPRKSCNLGDENIDSVTEEVHISQIEDIANLAESRISGFDAESKLVRGDESFPLACYSEFRNQRRNSRSKQHLDRTTLSRRNTVTPNPSTGFVATRYDWSLLLLSPKNRFRTAMTMMCNHNIFDYVILVFILLSCGVLAMEGPNIEHGDLKRSIIDNSMFVFTIIFTVEMLMKVIAMGLVVGPGTYLKDGWNILDGVLVLVSWIDVIITNTTRASPEVLGTLRVFRALRTLRPLRVIRRAPGLKLVVQTLLYSLKPIGNTVLIAAIFFVMFGILGVQLFKGKFHYCVGDSRVANRQQCLNSTRGDWQNRRYNFDNLLQALISLFVVSTRDGWVEIMHHGIDAVGVNIQPMVNYAQWRLVYFIPFLLLGGFLVLNMIVGVVVENFQICRERLDEEEQVRSKRMNEITVKKPQHEDNADYHVHYSKVRRAVHNVCTHQYWDIIIAVIICINVICMSLEHYQMSETYIAFVETTNYIFTTVFIIEVVIKVIALGWLRYIKDRWNIVDLVIVIMSVTGIIINNLKNNHLPINPTVIRTLRVMRITRVLKLVKLAKGVRSLLDTLFEALPQVANLGLLFLLLFFIYSCLGIQLFGTLECSPDYPCQGLSRHAHFRDFGTAMLTLFRIATGDNWNGILKDTLRSNCQDSADCNKNCCLGRYSAPLFFVTFVLAAQFVLVNVVVAVLMKHLKESKEKIAATMAAKDIEKKLRLLTLVAKNFIQTKAARKSQQPITRRRSVVELGLGGIELAQLKSHTKKWMDKTFHDDVIKADAIFQEFMHLNASLRKAKMNIMRTSSNNIERTSSLRQTTRVHRRHTISGSRDLSPRVTPAVARRTVWKSGCKLE